jgi:putative NADH-flavin reductase
LVTTPGFPAQYKGQRWEKGAAFLDRLGREMELNWTFDKVYGRLLTGG